MMFVEPEQRMTDKQSYALFQLSRGTESETPVSHLRAKYLDRMQASEIIGLLADGKYDLANVKINWILEDYLRDIVEINTFEEERD